MTHSVDLSTAKKNHGAQQPMIFQEPTLLLITSDPIQPSQAGKASSIHNEPIRISGEDRQRVADLSRTLGGTLFRRMMLNAKASATRNAAIII